MSYDYYNEYLTSLDGKTVEHIDVADDESALRFRCADGEAVVWVVDGECCSISYWADALSLGQLRGATVRSVHTLDLPDADEPENSDRYDTCIQVYGYAVVTDKGAATLAFRNSSNGYYGGSCHLGDGTYYKWNEIVGNAWGQGSDTKPVEPTPEDIAAEAASKFRKEVIAGLGECQRQLSGVIPAINHSPLGTVADLVDTVVELQDRRTSDILVLGVYLTRMAAETLMQNASTERPV